MRSKNSIGILAILAAIFLAGPALLTLIGFSDPAADVSVIAFSERDKIKFQRRNYRQILRFGIKG